MSMDITDVMRCTDWPLLREQKRALVAYVLEGVAVPAEHADGLLGFLDAVQDAVIEMGIAAPEDVLLYEGDYE